MRNEQLEAWVLSIVDQVQLGRRVEDSRVELKGKWPEAIPAARRIAAHANASRGDVVLWIIGLDEEKGLQLVDFIELADWTSQLAAQFEGIPISFTDLVVPTGNGTVTALLFDTSRRPYVVKNPNGGRITHEVPWREGTATRSARREDLIRILAPLQVLPHVEVLSATASVSRMPPQKPAYDYKPAEIQLADHYFWSFHIALYVTPQSPDLLVLPIHKTRLRAALDNEPLMWPVPRLFALATIGEHVIPQSETVSVTTSEAVLRGPGRLDVEGTFLERPRSMMPDAKLHLDLSLTPAGFDRSIDTPIVLTSNPAQLDNEIGRWTAYCE